jgi:O-antigen/teichoic acid export membrane protein
LTPEFALLSWATGQFSGAFLLYKSNLRNIGYVPLASIKESMNFRRHKHLGFYSLANVILTLDQVLLAQFSGQRQAGVYGSVFKWFTPLTMVSASASVVISNHAAGIAQTPRDAIRKTSSIWLVLITIAGTMCVVGWFLTPAVDIILGDDYRDAKSLIGFLAISYAIALINQPLSSVLQYFEREKLVSLITWTTVLLYLCTLGIALLLFPNQGSLIIVQLQIALQALILALQIYFVCASSRSQHNHSGRS